MIILAIDIAVLAIIAFCGWRGYRNGLIRGVFGVVTLIVSLLIAGIAANAYSEEFTDMLDPFVGGIIDSTIGEYRESEAEFDLTKYENESEDFKTAYSTLRKIGLPESAAAGVSKMVLEEDESGARPGTLSDRIASKLSSVLAFVAVFGIAFILLAIIFTVIGNLVGFVFSLPGLKIVDIAAGVAFGLAKGLLIVLVLAAVVRYAGLFAPDTINSTSVLKYFVNNNMVAERIGI
ncbi:MAG: CvpA family protein [Oscillospiraceae bacterium]|nr:CvpA family protein [Oscillospiraceae bacterium]